MYNENKLFYTKEELNKVKEKTRGVQLPNIYRHLKVIEILRVYGEERTRELIEEEIYIFKKSMIIFDLVEYYDAVNGREKEVADFVFKNRGEVMLTSIHDFIGLGKEFFREVLNNLKNQYSRDTDFLMLKHINFMKIIV